MPRILSILLSLTAAVVLAPNLAAQEKPKRPPNVIIVYVGRHGLRRSRLLRRQEDQDAEPRQDGPGRHPLHQLLRRPGRLLRIAGGPADRQVLQSRRHSRGPGPGQQERPGPQARTPSPRCSRRLAMPPASSANGTSAICPSSCRPAAASMNTTACPIPTTCGPSIPRPSFPTCRSSKARRSSPSIPIRARLTTDYTERAVKFIEKNKDRPFFLYLAHAMPHVPLFVSERFKGKSEAGLYGDVIMEIDWSVGQILETLQAARPRRQHAGHLHVRQRALAVLRQPRRHGGRCCARARARPGKGACACRSSPAGRAGFRPARRSRSRP